MNKNFCVLCEDLHEIEVVKSFAYKDVDHITCRCSVTGKEFYVTKQSPSTVEQIPEKSAFDLLDLDKVSSNISRLVPIQIKEGKERYLSEFIEVLSQELKVKFIGVHLVDHENWLVFQAGNNERINNLLINHIPKMKIVEHKSYFGQAGAALHTGEIRLVHWETAKIIGYKIIDDQIHERIVKNYAEPFQSPWYGGTELDFPLQNGNRKIGVLEFTFDFSESPWISHVELLKVQRLANQLTAVLSSSKYA